MFGGDELIFHSIGLTLGRFEHLIQFSAPLWRRSARDLDEMF